MSKSKQPSPARLIYEAWQNIYKGEQPRPWDIEKIRVDKGEICATDGKVVYLALTQDTLTENFDGFWSPVNGTKPKISHEKDGIIRLPDRPFVALALGTTWYMGQDYPFPPIEKVIPEEENHIEIDGKKLCRLMETLKKGRQRRIKDRKGYWINQYTLILSLHATGEKAEIVGTAQKKQKDKDGDIITGEKETIFTESLPCSGKAQKVCFDPRLYRLTESPEYLSITCKHEPIQFFLRQRRLIMCPIKMPE